MLLIYLFDSLTYGGLSVSVSPLLKAMLSCRLSGDWDSTFKIQFISNRTKLEKGRVCTVGLNFYIRTGIAHAPYVGEKP